MSLLAQSLLNVHGKWPFQFCIKPAKRTVLQPGIFALLNTSFDNRNRFKKSLAVLLEKQTKPFAEEGIACDGH
jgi:hypothetical protein